MIFNLIILFLAVAAIIYSIIVLHKANSISTEKEIEKAKELVEIQTIKQKKSELTNEVDGLRQQIEIINQQHAAAIESASEGMRKQQEQIKQGLEEYSLAIERSKIELLNKMNFEKKQATVDLEFYLQEINEQKQQELDRLNSLKKTIDALNTQIQNDQNSRIEKSKSLLQLNGNALKEIEILRSIEDKLTDSRPLRMIIWQSYFSKPANELCSRVLGKDEICGIYKITNTITRMCYIGQAKNVKTRWREHMKCGLGIDTPAGNKLYAAMQEDGIENFSFELLESCSPAELNEKERTYIDIFSSYDFGYNSNKGIKKEH